MPESTRKSYTHPELQNIAEDLDEEELLEIAGEIVENYKSDKDDLSAWETMHAKWTEIYFQQDRAKNPPWEGSSQESLPLLAEACNQFHSRSYLAMFAPSQLIQAVPTGKQSEEDTERADRVGMHMTWQLTVKDRTYKKNKDRLLLAVPLHGSFFTKAYYDPTLRRNTVRNVRPTDLIVPYGTGPRDLEDIERKTETIWMSVNQTKILEKEGYFIAAGESYQGGEETPVDKAHNDAQGVQQTQPDKGPCKILECHCVLDLDDDGIAEPYIVTVDEQSGGVLRISARWLTDEAGNPVDELGRQTQRKIPIEYYTHYVFLENPDGFYGLGLGHLIGQPNEAVNKMLRQTVDAGTLATVGNMGGLISETVAPPGGELEMVIGKFTKVAVSGEDLQKGVWTPKFPGPHPALTQALELIMARSDRLSTATEAVTGQMDKVMQPTAIMSLLEESGRIFSAVNERIVTSWNSELEKIYRLNATFMDPMEYYSVLDADGALLQREVHREDYAPDLQVKAMVDPKMSSRKQKLAQAELEWNFLSQNPLVQSSMVHFHNASRRFLRAIDSERIEEVLPSPDPLENLVAVLRMMGLDEEQMEDVIRQIGIIALEGESGDEGNLESLGQPVPGVALDPRAVNGTGESLQGPAGGSNAAIGNREMGG